MSTRRERAKAQKSQNEPKAMPMTVKPVRKEKLILEGGKFCLDIAKLVFGGVFLASIMQQGINVWYLLIMGFGVASLFSLIGLILINKLH